MILDEAQSIKNAASQAAKACRLLKARHRLALTGTPVENHIGELWSIFEFLNPGQLGSAARLRRFLADGRGSADVVARAVRPYLLRRTKAEVLSDLPEKTEQTLFVRTRRGPAEGLRRTAASLPGRTLRPDRPAGHRPLADRGARGPAAAAAGRLPSRPGRSGPDRRALRQARRAARAARRGDRRGPQGAGLQPVHQLPGDPPAAARRQAAAPTSTSTAGPPTARPAWPASRKTPTAGCF